MANRGRSPSTDGVRPRMQKMFDGRNMATRPIPINHDSADDRAIAAAAADSKPKTSAVQFPSRGKGAKGVNDAVFGKQVAAPGNVAKGAPFDPLTGTQNFE
jgi:hypothetical protein